MTRPEELRLFIAVELPPDVLQALQDIQDELRKRDLGGLRWTRPEGIHLTLKFLGETPAGRAPAIKEALAAALEGVASHTLSLGRAGTFGSGNAPRVLWVDLQGDVGALSALQQRVETAMERLGFRREDRRFSPHLTLARVRPEEARSLARPLAQALASVRVPALPVPVREVSLVRSQLGPGGAVYTRLWAAPLTQVE